MKESIENSIRINSVYEHAFRFSQEDVITFAEATGDRNPIHLDNEYATKSIFKKRILHGFLGGSIFSKVFGTLFPGKGTIYLKQDMSFYKPMYTDVDYMAVFKVIETFPEKKRALVKTDIIDKHQNIITAGEALISHESIR
jgi:3-hydroxybutyryl-CoA dehydratase